MSQDIMKTLPDQPGSHQGPLGRHRQPPKSFVQIFQYQLFCREDRKCSLLAEVAEESMLITFKIAIDGQCGKQTEHFVESNLHGAEFVV